MLFLAEAYKLARRGIDEIVVGDGVGTEDRRVENPRRLGRIYDLRDVTVARGKTGDADAICFDTLRQITQPA